MEGKRYSVPIRDEGEDTWERIKMAIHPLDILYDKNGNPRNGHFHTEKTNFLGDFYVFQSGDKRIANKVRRQIKRSTSLDVLPVLEVDGI